MQEVCLTITLKRHPAAHADGSGTTLRRATPPAPLASPRPQPAATMQHTHRQSTPSLQKRALIRPGRLSGRTDSLRGEAADNGQPGPKTTTKGMPNHEGHPPLLQQSPLEVPIRS